MASCPLQARRSPAVNLVTAPAPATAHACMTRHARRFIRLHAVTMALRSTWIGLGIALSMAPFVSSAAEPSGNSVPSNYTIAPGSLGNVLAQFAAAAGVPLSFDPAPLAQLHSAGLNGRYTAQEGFAKLLDGTGFELVNKGDGAYSVRRMPDGATTTLSSVTVSGSTGVTATELPPAYAGGQVARGGRLGLLGNKEVMDTPFNVSSYTSDFLTNRHAVTLADALNSDPSVRFTGQIGGITDSFYIRGFPIGEGNLGEIAFDGVYGVAPNYHVFTEYVERVEVVKGPAALLYGISPNSGVGGVINIVPKRALPQDLTRVTADYASSSLVGGHLDFSRRLGDDHEWGIRFNGSHRQGDTPLDNQQSRTNIGALSLDYQGERFRSSLDLISQHEKIDAPTRPFLLAPGIQVPTAPDGRRNVTQSWGWWKSDEQAALLRAEYDLTDSVTLFANAGGSKTDIARLSDQTPTILNEAGDVSSYPTHFLFKVDRSTYDTGLRAKFDTGPVKHSLSLQASLYKDSVSKASNTGTEILTNIYRPISRPAQNVAEPASVPKVSSSELSGLALADTLSAFDERAQLTLGLRHQRIKSDNFNANGSVSSAYDKSALTPLVGLVIKPWENVSVYANYIEGLSKGDTAPSSASNAGQVFAPYKSKQHEIGIKFDFDSAMLTLSAFQVSKPSGQLTGTVYAADSEQRNRGLELNLSGEPARGVRLLGGVTLLDAELTKTSNPNTRGNQPVGVPKIMLSMGAEWDLPWVNGLTLNTNATYTGREYVDQANTQSVPSWVTFDFGARYTTKMYGKNVTLRGTVINAFNRGYWSGVASYGTISQGAPRTLMLSASMDF